MTDERNVAHNVRILKHKNNNNNKKINYKKMFGLK